MKPRFFGAGLLLLGVLANPASAELSYNQDLEGLDPNSESALADDGWLVGANVFDSTGTTFQYNYFAFPAPNVAGGGPAFSGVATGEGGPDQGDNQFNTYNDYNNGDHTNNSGNRIEANIFRDAGILSASDVGRIYTFAFDAKQGNIGGATTANAFLKVLKTSDNSFAELAIDAFDTTSIGTNWSGGSASLTIDSGMVGETLQFGFVNIASNGDPSGVFYDNLVLSSVVPEPGSFLALAIGGIGIAVRRRRR